MYKDSLSSLPLITTLLTFARSAEKILRFDFARSAEKIFRFDFEARRKFCDLTSNPKHLYEKVPGWIQHKSKEAITRSRHHYGKIPGLRAKYKNKKNKKILRFDFAQSAEKILRFDFARSAEKIVRFDFARSAEKILRFDFARSAEKILRFDFEP